MKLLNFIFSNYDTFLILILVLWATIFKIKSFNAANLRQWLVFGVAEAERQLGSGTGQLKLRLVYNMFCEKYPLLSKIIAFDTFSIYVDEALKYLDKIIKENDRVKEFIEGAV